MRDLTAVTTDLAAAGITLVIDRESLSAGDAWIAAANKHGHRVAVAHDPTTKLWLSHPHTHPEVGQAVAETFARHGFSVDWDGDPHNTVTVDLSKD